MSMKHLFVQCNDLYNNCDRLLYTMGGNMKPPESRTLHFILCKARAVENYSFN